MFLEITISIIFGCLLGVITGLTPGVHINLIAALISTNLTNLLDHTTKLNLVVLIVSMSITHIFLDIIPSIFLGIPSEDSAVIILPAHKLILEGKAHEAIILTLLGTISSTILILSLVPTLIFIIPKIYLFIKNYIIFVLIIAATFLITKEKNRFDVLIVFLLSGVLGVVVLNLPNIKEPLLPLLSGLFGLSSLILSIKNNTKIPEQKIEKIKIEFKKLKFVILGTISGLISAFLPGLGSSQTSVLSTSFLNKIDKKDYLILNSSINAVNIIGSFITLYSINKSRSGVAATISKILGKLKLLDLLLIISIIMIVTFIATLLTIFFSKIFSKIINKVNYKKLCFFIITSNIILVLFVSKYVGLMVLVTSTSLGIYAQLKEVNKNQLMGCLLLPVILYFLL